MISYIFKIILLMCRCDNDLQLTCHASLSSLISAKRTANHYHWTNKKFCCCTFQYHDGQNFFCHDLLAGLCSHCIIPGLMVKSVWHDLMGVHERHVSGVYGSHLSPTPSCRLNSVN